MTVADILTTRLCGGRFAEHVIPLVFFRDLAAFEKMLIEVAKWEYKKEYPDRKRLPRNFAKQMVLNISSISEGSVILSFALSCFLGHFEHQEMKYITEASQSVSKAIFAAEKGESFAELLPKEAFAQFEVFGRGLHEGESMELPPFDTIDKVIYTKATRQKILLALSSTKEYTEETSFRASVPDLSQTQNKIDVLLPDGQKVRIPLDREYKEIIFEALRGYSDNARVQIRGVGRFSQDGKLLEMVSVDDLAALDPLDVGARLDELSQLQDGWLDGEGKAPPPKGIKWLADCFDRYFLDELQLPYLCPTEDGGICAEWPLDPLNLSLEINLESHRGYWHAMDFTNDTFIEKEDIDLNQPASWNWLCEQLERKGGVS